MTREQYDNISARLPHRRLKKEDVYKISYEFPKSPKKEDIIEWLIDSCFIENYIIKLSDWNETNIDDIIQDVYLDLLELPQEKYDLLTYQGYGAIKAYVSGMIYRQIKSGSSPIYYRYKGYKKHEVNVSPESWSVYEQTNKITKNDNYETEDN